MRKALPSLVALGLLAACAGAQSDPMASGNIVEMTESSITLDPGGTFLVPEDKRHMLNGLKPDEGAYIVYEERDGEKVLQEIGTRDGLGP
jgi:hypothetical protein